MFFCRKEGDHAVDLCHQRRRKADPLLAKGAEQSDGEPLNAATEFITTHRPESLEWGPFEGFGPAIVEGIRRIKSQDGPDLILSGSSTLTSTLLEHGLADEVVLAVYPVLLGTGKRFFAEGTPPRSFELVSTNAFPSGIIFSTYGVAGPLNRYRVEEIDDPLTRKVRYLAKLVDELAKGRKMEKVLRSTVSRERR